MLSLEVTSGLLGGMEVLCRSDLHYMTNIQDSQQEREDLLWSMDAELLVHGHFALLP